MTSFQFKPVTPHPLLRPYIAKMSVFESSGRLPEMDKKLIVPNSNFKLTVTCRNGIIAKLEGKTFVQNEDRITLSGLIDAPVNLNPQEDTRTSTIVVEFNQLGVYRLFSLPFAEIKNQIIDLPDLIGRHATAVQRRLAEVNTLEEKVQVLELFLIRQLEVAVPDPIYDYCISRISDTKGLIKVAQLEKETGYTSRWLNKKFSEHLGTSPKNLAEIVKFKQFYEVYSATGKLQGLKDHIYSHYHDQSHFLRAFKRFTGFTPGELQNSMNELATRHYSS
jgi:AraC-like DNA-binding protein